jgi:hypothetical protein
MGIPGAETALEELMCRILGDYPEYGIAAKLADDLYCGADSPHQLEEDPRCPPKVQYQTFSIQNHYFPTHYHYIRLDLDRAMPIRKHTQNCYNVIVSAFRYGTWSSVFYRSLQNSQTCFTTGAHIIAPLQSAIAGQQLCDKIKWSDTLYQHF